MWNRRQIDPGSINIIQNNEVVGYAFCEMEGPGRFVEHWVMFKPFTSPRMRNGQAECDIVLRAINPAMVINGGWTDLNGFMAAMRTVSQGKTEIQYQRCARQDFAGIP